MTNTNLALKNLTAEEIMGQLLQKGEVRMDRQLVMVRNIGRGNNKVQKYHNFDSGRDYDTLKEATEGKPITMIVKESACGKKETLTDDPTIDVNGLYNASSSKELVVYDIVNINGEDYISVAECLLDTTVPKEGERRHLKLEYLYFIDKMKGVYKRTYRGIYERGDKSTVGCMHIDNIINYNSLSVIRDTDLKDITTRFGWDVVNFGANRRCTINASFILKDFLKYKEPAKKNGPKQRMIDELTSKPLEELNPKITEDISKERKYAIISKVEDCEVPTVCLRTFAMTDKGNASEGGRIYVAGKNSIACKQNTAGEWVQMNLNAANSNFNYSIAAITANANLVGTSLEYLSDVLKEKFALPLIAATLANPYVEMLYKNDDFKEIVIGAASISYNSVADGISSSLGQLNTKEKNFYKLVGFNKNQIKFVKDYITTIPEEVKHYSWNNPFLNRYNGDNLIFKSLKDIFNTTYLNDIDIETIKMVLDFMVKAYAFNREVNNGKIFTYSDGTTGKYAPSYSRTSIQEVLSNINNLSGLTTLRALLKDDKLYNLYIYREEYMANKYNFMEKAYVDVLDNMSYWGFYADFLRMAREVKETAEALKEPVNYKISVGFSNHDDVKLIHDDIMPVANHYRDLMRAYGNKERIEAAAKKWESRKSVWKKWLYSDNEYTVVLPETPIALSAEGSALHHCVGSYIDKVSSGKTNILFIRKIDDIDKPLFTVEMSNSSVIEQIHGSCNSRITDVTVVEKHPHIQEFVNSWIKTCGLEAYNYNKVR